jgi:DAK2 domain fusion protein YloV
VTALEVMDGAAVRQWCRLAADALAQARAAIDALNVFPVPDADTGTNLQLTMRSAAQAVEALPETTAAAQLWQAAAHGAMLGAAGNSGTILSQLLRGLSDVCAPAERCDGQVITAALAHAAVIARAAVSRPVEGTVLTVADAAARAAAEHPGRRDLPAVVTAAALGARTALARTTGQLDVLAASGVVDAGGAGLCVLLDALAATITGAGPVAPVIPAGRGQARPAGSGAGPQAASGAPGPSAAGGAPGAPASSGGYGYEVIYLLAADAAAVAALRDTLDSLGDCVVIVGGEPLWNVHVHLADAGAAIEAGIRAGRPSRIAVTYLGPTAPEPAGSGRRAVIAVADGDGPASLLQRAGARVVRGDGGTDPAAPALLAAARHAGREVIIVPNAYSVVTAAQAAAAGLEDEGLTVAVIGSRSPLQALAAMAVHLPERPFGADVAAMERAAAGLRYGSVIRRGDSLAGLVADQVTVTGANAAQVAIGVTEALMTGGGELVTLMAEGAADSPLPRAVAAHVTGRWPEAEVVCYGDGPVPLLVGVE